MAYISRPLSSSRFTSGLHQMRGAFRIRPKVQLVYFDRNIIKTRWPRFNRDPLMHAGNLVMRIARGSIRRRKRLRGKPSAPGQPPYSRQPGSTPPFKQIFSVPFRLGTSVAVGMVGYHLGASGPAVPGLHEHGGSAFRFVFASGGQRRLKSGKMGKRITTYKRRSVRYPQRPFMWPALLRARARLPHLWLHSISRG
jgi:hypothetical protein